MSAKKSVAKNVFYAQSGGVTAVINASAAGVIAGVKKYKSKMNKIFAGKNGILGALHEELIDVSKEAPASLKNLLYTPGGAFGSCRFKLGSLEQNRSAYERLIEVFQAHDIGYFFYNGGGDSQDTTYKMACISREMGYPLTCIGIPKTIDNDLPFTHYSPGFGSVAKYVAISIQEASIDLASMATSSTQVFILEVMGRHAGWIAAAAGLAQKKSGDAPHIILFPEVPFVPENFLARVASSVKKYGFCSIVVSEGARYADGRFLSETGSYDAFGHAQLGGVAAVVAQLIKTQLGYKYHYAIADYLQRAARHIASQVDVDLAYALGEAAVDFAAAGENGIMPIVQRSQAKRSVWSIGQVDLAKVANQEKHMPKNFINQSGFGITQACRDYLLPLIQGEAYPPYQNGLPSYVTLKKQLVKKKCPPFNK
jgi:ATP-dependent phosphofructokinase / diphosphate-dependent phosphofructokinase